MLDVILILSMY